MPCFLLHWLDVNVRFLRKYMFFVYQHEEKMQALDDFFSHRALPLELFSRVRQYHEKMFEMSHGTC